MPSELERILLDLDHMVSEIAEWLGMRLYITPDTQLPSPAPTTCWSCDKGFIGAGEHTLHCSIMRPDVPDYVMNFHSACFDAIRNAEVGPEPQGTAPRPWPKCLICSELIPRVGRHPWILKVQLDGVERRFWLHAAYWPAAGSRASDQRTAT